MSSDFDQPSGPPPRLAVDVCRDFELSDEAKKLLAPKLTAEVFFDQLVKEGQFPDAIRVISRLLTPKQAVWWGCLCVWAAHRDKPPPEVNAAVGAVVKWLKDGTDESRRAAREIGEKAGPATPAGMLATSAFLSEGLLSNPGSPEVPTDPSHTPKVIASTVITSARLAGKANANALMRQFLAVAVDVSRGTNSWTKK